MHRLLVVQALKVATVNVNGVNGRLPRLLEWLAERETERSRAGLGAITAIKSPEQEVQ